ncbi:hypothetical protein V6N13_020345 [Hibiscus sabdariffa]
MFEVIRNNCVKRNLVRVKGKSDGIGYIISILTYCVVAVESIGRQVPIAFLERISVDFTKRYGGGKAATAPANSLSKEFGPKLKEHMQHCNDHPEEISKIAKVKAQVSEVKGVMMENIEKVLDRGEKIELLVDKTENLRSQIDHKQALFGLVRELVCKIMLTSDRKINCQHIF